MKNPVKLEKKRNLLNSARTQRNQVVFNPETSKLMRIATLNAPTLLAIPERTSSQKMARIGSSQSARLGRLMSSQSSRLPTFVQLGRFI